MLHLNPVFRFRPMFHLVCLGHSCTWNGLDLFFVLSIGRHVKFDARASKILTPLSLCENPLLR